MVFNRRYVHRTVDVPLSHSNVARSHSPGLDPSLDPRGVLPWMTEQFQFELRWNYSMEVKYRGKKERFPVSMVQEQSQIYL